MKYTLEDTSREFCADHMFSVATESLVSNEDLFGMFMKKLTTKIGVWFGMHAAYSKYIKDNLSAFDHLNKNAVVRTVLAKDLSLVAAALQYVNEGLEKLKLGGKLDLVDWVGQELESAGITYERGRISIVNFKSGNWGDGKDKTGLNAPMTYSKTIEDHKWLEGGKIYAERFIDLTKDIASKGKLITASNKHFADVKNAHAKGIHRNQAVLDKQIAIDQINQLTTVRNVLIKFFFKQLCAIMKGADIQPIGEIPKEVKIPNTYVGK